MLSAAGKELGMIEDASVAIDMLRDMEVDVVRGKGDKKRRDSIGLEDTIEVVRSDSGDTNLTATEENTEEVKIGGGEVEESVEDVKVDLGAIKGRIKITVILRPDAYDSTVPEALKGASVRFFPILFQMGVDIKQWGKNLVTSSSTSRGGPKTAASVGNYVEDGDGDAEPVGADLLTDLNNKAMSRMNKYYHEIDNFGYQGNDDKELPIHPSLGKLFNYVQEGGRKVSCYDERSDDWGELEYCLEQHQANPLCHAVAPARSSQIQHGLLDAAGDAGRDAGGGAVIYCKSGKDRTGMGVTLRERQWVEKWWKREGTEGKIDCERMVYVLRRFGTRIMICEKNVGKATYAFNALQAKFMPEDLKPPPECLAKMFDYEKVET